MMNTKDVKFFADAMLGRLALWMRVLGYDVEYHGEIDDEELIKRALREGRIILTRDTLLVKRRAVRGAVLFIKGDHLEEQLQQVVTNYRPRKDHLLTRCLGCNTILEDIDRDSIKGRVPEYVYATQERFAMCPSCRRIYWAGTHREEMLSRLKRLLPREE